MSYQQLTIVMPVYNGAAFIDQTIQSICKQTFTNWKLIVINDCSDDNTSSIVESLVKKDDRITLLDNATNIRVANTMNKGISLVNTPFFARVDSDDILLEDHFEKIISYLSIHPEISVCGSQVLTINENNKFLRRWFYEQDPLSLKISAIFACPFLQSSVIIKTDAIKDLQGYRNEMELVEDYELWIRALQKYNCANIPDFTIKYRIHSNNMSETNKSKILALLQNVYIENAINYPIDKNNLDLHARMEFGDWSMISNSDLHRVKEWRGKLKKINDLHKFYPENIYNRVVKKYFTNAYLKIATQNGGILRYRSITKAFLLSPSNFIFIWRRKSISKAYI